MEEQAKKLRICEEDLKQSKKLAVLEGELRTKFLKELEALSFHGKKERLSVNDLAKKLKDDPSYAEKALKTLGYELP